MTVGSEVSSRAILEKMPKREIHGQTPNVLPCNKQSLSFFEGVTRKDVPMDSMPPMSGPTRKFSIHLKQNYSLNDLEILVHHMMHPPMGLPLPMPRGGPMDGHYRFPPQGSVILRGGPPGMNRPSMQITLGPRGPVTGGQMVLGRMPGPPPQQHVLVMQQSQRPGLPPHVNGPPLVRQPIRPGAPGEYNTQIIFFLIDFIAHFSSRSTSIFKFNDSYAWPTSTRLLPRTTNTRSRSMYCL